jgi:hypothetical protein
MYVNNSFNLKYLLIISALFFLTGALFAQQDAAVQAEKNEKAVDTASKDSTAQTIHKEAKEAPSKDTAAETADTEIQDTISQDSTAQIIEEKEQESDDIPSVKEMPVRELDHNQTTIASLIEMEKKKQIFIDAAGEDLKIASYYQIAGYIMPLIGAVISTIGASGKNPNVELAWVGFGVTTVGGLIGFIGETVYTNKAGKNLKLCAEVRFNMPSSNPFHKMARGISERKELLKNAKQNLYSSMKDRKEEKISYIRSSLGLSIKGNKLKDKKTKTITFSISNKGNKNISNVIVKVLLHDRKGEIISALVYKLFADKKTLKPKTAHSISINIQQTPEKWDGSYEMGIMDFDFVE